MGSKTKFHRVLKTQLMETNKQVNIHSNGLCLFENQLNNFENNLEYYYGRCKYNKQTPRRTKNLYYYGRYITMADITMAE